MYSTSANVASLLLLLQLAKMPPLAAAAPALLPEAIPATSTKDGGDSSSSSSKPVEKKADPDEDGKAATPADDKAAKGKQTGAAADDRTQVNTDSRSLVPSDGPLASTKEGVGTLRIDGNASSGNLVAQSADGAGAGGRMQPSGSGHGAVAKHDDSISSLFSGIDGNLVLVGGVVIASMLVLGLVAGAVIARIRRRGRSYY